MIRLALIPLFLAGASDCFAAGDPVVDQLTQPQMQEIFQHLKTKSLTAARLTDEELNRAAIQGLMQRLGTGASLIPIPQGPPPAAGKLLSELLTDKIAYLRPATFTVQEMASLDVALDTLTKSTAATLILDLRAPAPHSDAIAAAQLLSRFLPEATAVFQVRKVGEEKPRPFVTKGKPRWTRGLVLLTDAETNNTAETVGAVLQQHFKCIVIGTPTLGQAMDYRTQPISVTHQLRLAESEVLLADNVSLFGRGIQPDLPTPFDLALKKTQFTESEKSGMRKFAYEMERPRMNEAALVAQTNPEIDYQIARSANKPTGFDSTAPNDAVLQQAVDFLVAQEFLRTAPVSEIRKAEPK